MLSNDCTACGTDSKVLNSMQAIALLDHISDDWSINMENKLFASYKFEDFSTALKFVVQISKIAEQQNHHPDINFGWGYVEITLYTHALSGLHENDFILAKKIDKIRYKPVQQSLL